MSGQREYGNGYVDGRPMYYEQEGDRMDIFPGGMPDHRPHDHIVVQGDNVTYMRENGQTVVDNR